MILHEVTKDRAFLIATPEKALADLLLLKRGLRLRSLREMSEYLTEDLRIPREELLGLDMDRIRKIREAAATERVTLFANVIQHLQQNRETA